MYVRTYTHTYICMCDMLYISYSVGIEMVMEVELMCNMSEQGCEQICENHCTVTWKVSDPLKCIYGTV